MKNADKLLFRASSMAAIMSGTGKGWPIEKSITCQRKLVDMYREHAWKRRNPLKNKYVTKGLEAENDSITLYSRFKKKIFKKNDTRLTNEFFTGELDLYEGESITKATKVIDIKSCWDWTTLPSCIDVNDDYEEQINVYLDLTGALVGVIAYCLVNTPAELITDEKRRLAYKMGILDEETEEYILQCIEIEKNCIVDIEQFKKDYPFFEFHCSYWQYDIPMEERVVEIEFKRNEVLIMKMKQRVIESRVWMNKNLFKNG